MAKGSKLTIRVEAARATTTVRYWTSGTYGRLTVNDVRDTMGPEPLFPSSGSKAFWEAVLNAVVADITAGNGGGT